ncbi:hypothetical protein [Rhodoferax ferrireducens]|uniref:hypothetical protein n=1 Tax=Rhodoferax ferrireducens TaxID=192843 RepID=UPI000E0D7A50|nr:hypothetical protein [Rhodoferax ferrireducens]
MNQDLRDAIMNLPRNAGMLNLDHQLAYKMGHRDARHAAAALVAAAPEQKPTAPDNMQDWAGMDGAIAFHLIERHADNWADASKMMGEWLAANQAQPAAEVELSDDEIIAAIHGAPQENPGEAGWIKRQRIAWARAVLAARKVRAG